MQKLLHQLIAMHSMISVQGFKYDWNGSSNEKPHKITCYEMKSIFFISC